MQDTATALDYMAHDLVCFLYGETGEARAHLWLNPGRMCGPSDFDVKLGELFAACERPALPDGLRDLIAREARKTDPLPVPLILGLLLGVGLALIVTRRG